MRRKIITKANLPGPKPPVDCAVCNDTGTVEVKAKHGGPHKLACTANCKAAQEIAREKREKQINADAKALRNTPCVGCGNRGYIQWADDTRTPCPRQCGAVPVAKAMGLID